MAKMLFITGLGILIFSAAFVPPMPTGTFTADAATPLSMRFIDYVREHVAESRPTPKTRPIYRVTDPSLQHPLTSVEWAIKRRDLRACDRIPPHSERTDLLLLCVAVVVEDASRCSFVSSSLLRTLCHDLSAA